MARQRREKQREQQVTAPPVRAVPWRVLAPLILVAAGVIAYCNSLHGPFIFDDDKAIAQNPSIRKLWPLHEAMIAPPRNTFAGRPVANLSFAINYAMFGLDVRGYHATNILIHVLAALALFGVLRRALRLPRVRDCFGRAGDALALSAALLWEVHPLLTEVVTYTSTRTEGLMALFFLLTHYCSLRAFEPADGTKWKVAAVAACAVGMGCKEVMAAAPLLVYLCDALLVHGSLTEPARRRPGFYLALAATWAIVPALLLFFVDFSAKSGMGLERMTPWVYALTQSGVIVHYLLLSLRPHPLTIDYYDWPLAHSIADVWPQALVVMALLAVTVWGVVKRRPAALLGAWVLLILAPTSSFIPLGSEVAAERRMYLPLAAIVCAIVLVAHRLIGRRRGAAMAVVAIFAVALTAMTLRRNGDHATRVSIWASAVEARPRNLRALTEFTRVLQVDGYPKQALEVAQRVVEIDSTYPQARATLGALLIGEGRLGEAVEHLRAGVKLEPDNALARANLGLALARLNRTDDAVAHYRAALEIDPDLVDAHVYLAEALASQGKTDEARTHLEIALKLQPNAADIRGRLNGLK